jgi:prepilin-type N-terminal cleavage/methylation domain-containing protein
MDFSKAFRLNSLRRNNAGFTLIELAIVLIVIGLILAAIVKSGDLINDAQISNFITNPVRRAEIDAMTYYTKTGTFASGNSTKGPLYNMFTAGVQDVINVRNPYTANGNSLALALGVINIKNTDGTYANYPVIVIEPVNVSSSGGISSVASWTTSTLNYAIRLKTVIDGNQNWSAGAVRFWRYNGNNIGVGFNSLQTEIGSTNAQIINYDGYVPNTVPDSSATDFTLAPSVALGKPGDANTLFYFYYQTPY